MRWLEKRLASLRPLWNRDLNQPCVTNDMAALKIGEIECGAAIDADWRNERRVLLRGRHMLDGGPLSSHGAPVTSDLLLVQFVLNRARIKSEFDRSISQEPGGL